MYSRSGSPGADAHDVAIPDLLRQRGRSGHLRCGLSPSRCGRSLLCPTCWDTVLSSWTVYRTSACSTRRLRVLRAIEECGPPDPRSSCRRPPACRGRPLHRLAVALETPRPAATRRRRAVLPRARPGRRSARAAADASRSPALARPRSSALREHTGESVQLYVREGDARRCVVSLQSPHGLRWIVPEGALLPLDLGSAGRVLSGELGEPGWIETVEEREPGVASVSAPVRPRRRPGSWPRSASAVRSSG